MNVDWQAWWTSAILLGLTIGGGICLLAEEKSAPDSSRYRLPNGWSISPAGRQIELGGLPLRLVPVPGGPYVVVTSNGYTEHFLAAIDVRQAEVIQRVPIAEGWLGLAVTPDGRRVYASAGSQDRVLIYDLTAGRPDEKTAYVSNWGAASVAVVDVAAGRVAAELQVQERPNDLALTSDEKSLFVSCGNRNTVSVIDTQRREVIEQIDVAVVPNSPGFRGPTGQGISTEKNLSLTWSLTENLAWRVEVPGIGWSSPVVWEDCVFVTASGTCDQTACLRTRYGRSAGWR